jgi:hypothetical protein
VQTSRATEPVGRASWVPTDVATLVFVPRGDDVLLIS